jgi:hypothetical protein
MTIYDGVVTVDDDSVAVIIGFEEERLRMSAGGAEIGEWASGEYSIDHDGEGVYTITAENETLRFIPNSPSLFAARVNGNIAPVPSNELPTRDAAVMSDAAAAPTTTEPKHIDNDEAPLPRPTTLVAFYALAGVTATLGLWALLSLFTG